jgi:uncharacterized membrane protein YGL010W
MKTLDTWLSDYGESHQNSTNKNIHRVCVPLIMMSLLGLVGEIPVPAFLDQYSLNFSHVVVVLAMLFYLSLSLSFSALMIVVVGPMLVINFLVQKSLSSEQVLTLWVTVFVLSWVGQFVGHKIEGKKPSFFKDLAFLLIGPLWIVAPLFSRYR